MRVEISRRIRIGLGLSFVMLTLGTVVVILNYGQGYYDSGFNVSAVFPASSQGIFTDGGTAVKMRGLNIGSVSDIEILDDGRARLTLFLDDGVLVPEGAMASIEPLSVFGPKFVRIDPGPTELTGPYLDEDGEILLTAVSPELTEILAQATELFEHIDPHELIAIFDAIAEGVTGLGPEMGSIIDDGAALLAVGADHTDDLRQFLDDAAALASVTASRSSDLVATIANVRLLAPLVVEHADDIDELLVAATSISTDFATLLDENRGAVDAFVTGTARFVDGVYLHATEIPDFVDLIASFFGGLADVLRMPGPEGSGTVMGALRGFMSLQPCLLLGVCFAQPAGTASASSAEPLVALTETLIGPTS